jgi:hypothetical protein
MTVPTAAVSEEDWNSQREALLVKEKELTVHGTRWPPSGAGSPWSGWRRDTASRGPRVRSASSTCSRGVDS